MQKPEIKIYTDGACANNPGKGGYGIVLIYKDKNENVHEKHISKGYRLTTNNRMELMAVISALETLKSLAKLSYILIPNMLQKP